MRKRLLFFVLLGLCGVAGAQQGLGRTQQASDSKAAEIQELRMELARISARLDALEASESHAPGAPGASAAPAATNAAVSADASAPAAVTVSPAGATAHPASASAAAVQPALSKEDRATLEFFRHTTLNFGLDGYYEYNFNHPLGRVNLLRAYDVSSNSFSINQADVMMERLPAAEPGQRFGGRIDLMFGQATETLGGNPENEQRPQVWRNLYQAYGSYLAPVGSGWEFDFGKFASSLGNEGNYTKDQINYSRGYLFNYLPFYHTGLRTNYSFTKKLNVAYWAVNGAQQTEAFSGSKSQAVLLTITPASTVTWNVNYFFGDQNRDVEPTLNPGAPTEPTQPGLPTTAVSPVPNGREHIFDTYASWQATPKLLLKGEADFVVNRVYTYSQPGRVALGAFYFQYLLPRSWYAGGRTEYLDDRGGLFSGTTQALKEVTLTANKQVQPGFDLRFEYRRDFSNRPFFLTPVAGVVSPSQTTATVGLIYWWGQKDGAW